MKEIEDLLNDIEEGLNNLKSRTDFNKLKHTNLIPIIISSISNYAKSNNLSYIKGMLNQFRQSTIATTEASQAYDDDIWNTNIEVGGKQTTLEEIFTKLESELKEIKQIIQKH